jgi:hypothetical protein
MSLFGLILTVSGLGFLSWLLFTLATYALPVFVGLEIGIVAFHSGAGYLGALAAALIAGSATFTLGKLAFSRARSPFIRAAIGLLFSVPASFVGYYATLDLARLGTPSEAWCVALAVIGAVVVGTTAWCRVTGLVISTESLHAAPQNQGPL